MFDAASNRWTHAEVTDGVDRDELTVATFNIWFDEYFADDRYLAIAELLARDMPDVMVFQEVTPAALDAFSAQPWIRDHYLRAAAVNGLGNYGMLMLSRLPITRATYTRLPTRLARGFLEAEFTINGHPLIVCSVHLESGRAAAGLRARQLNRVFGALRGVDDAVVLGDFNMRDIENERIGPPWVDAWPALRPHDDGFTEDTSINLMRLDSKDKHRQVRFDRVLFKGTAWAAKNIDLLGTEPISSAHPRVFPSDHFGVQCRFIRQHAAVGEATRRRRLPFRVPSLRVRPARRSGWLRR
ncbi:MAG: tyrosyl-DNA phosphodiesterase 2 [Mycobacterium sp.]|jgi:tyrosyl-DNA phosphodiesterase 2|nr:tyrosyl-DNA phosphodiesterase 2 [Mycobacterium sp.]